MVREPIDAPEAVFARVLHCLTGNLRQIENMEYSFGLVADNGALELLHVIDRSEVAAVSQVLLESPDISEQAGENLIQRMTGHAEQALKHMAEAGRDEPFDVSYRIEVAEVLDVVEDAIAEKGFGLLVVGTHLEGRSHVDAGEYQLMHSVRNIPVLAL